MPDAMIVEYDTSFRKVVPEGDQRWGFLVCVLFARVVRTDDELGGPHFEGDIEDDPLRSEPVHPDLHVQLVVEIIGKKAMILVDVLYDL